MSDATLLLRAYWWALPFAILLDGLILGGMSYGIWRSIRRYVARRR